jgi:hypothetical protein
MTRISGALQRALILVTLAAAALTVGLLAVPGEETIVGFQVPNESDNGSLTTRLTVSMATGTAAAGEFVPQTDKVSFPAAQSYSDVSVVNALVVGAVAVTLTLVGRRS